MNCDELDPDIMLGLALQQEEDTKAPETFDLDRAIALALAEQEDLYQTCKTENYLAYSAQTFGTFFDDEATASSFRRREVLSGAAHNEENEIEEQRKADGGQTKAASKLTHDGEQISIDEAIAVAHANSEVENAMTTSLSGKAWRFVEAVLELEAELLVSKRTRAAAVARSSRKAETVAVDDMLFMVEKMVETQAAFEIENKPTHISLGYHYTQKENLANIKVNGLLSHSERKEKGVSSNFNGSFWGDGVYTANDPYAYCKYGEVGLLVARLHGESRQATSEGIGFVGDTAIAFGGTKDEMVVLRSSYQCVPLIQFKRSMIQTNVDLIWKLHSRLQQLVDKIFNYGISTKVTVVKPPPPKLLPLSVTASSSCSTSTSCGLPVAVAVPIPMPVPAVGPRSRPTRLPWSFRRSIFGNHKTSSEIKRAMDGTPLQSETYQYNAPPSLSKRATKRYMPSGTMRVSFYSKDVLVCDQHASIVLVYSIPAGDCCVRRFKKGDGHIKHCFMQLLAFLPDHKESRQLLERLKFAFCHGLTFYVNHAIKTPQGDSTICSNIPHKRSPYGGFPDDKFIDSCHASLNDLGVPSFSACQLVKYQVPHPGRRSQR